MGMEAKESTKNKSEEETRLQQNEDEERAKERQQIRRGG